MPEFSTDVDIDPSEFVSECGRAEKIELIDLVVEECADDTEHQRILPAKCSGNNRSSYIF